MVADPLVTLTHARLRAAQGDLSGALRVASKILDTRPGDTEARDLIRSLSAQDDDPGGTALGPDEIRARVARLRAWLDRVLAG